MTLDYDKSKEYKDEVRLFHKKYRYEIFKYHNDCCGECGSFEKLQVHHRTYIKNKDWNNLQLLCKTCHLKFHSEVKRQIRNNPELRRKRFIYERRKMWREEQNQFHETSAREPYIKPIEKKLIDDFITSNNLNLIGTKRMKKGKYIKT